MIEQRLKESREAISGSSDMAGDTGCHCDRMRRLDHQFAVRHLANLGALLVVHGFIWAGRIGLDAFVI